MAIGRQDYMGGVVPVKSEFGLGQTNIVQKESKSIIAGTTVTIIEYQVPTGYIFYLNSMYFHANAPGLNSILLTIPGFDEFYFYFDTMINLKFSDAGTPVGGEGETFKVRYKNNEIFEHVVFCFITGILIQLT